MNEISIYQEYKFRDVYEFASIINKFVECDTEFWAYDVQQFINASTKFNKISLLHIYIYTQLLNYYNKKYFKDGDCYEYEEYVHWKDVAASYNIKFLSEFEDKHESFYDWYIENEKVFKELFQHITNEVFFVLFNNHPFLVKFNNLVAQLIKNENREERDWNYPSEALNENGTIKRCYIPEWVKSAVFHRDHGRCIFCGKDLTRVYSHSNMVNYDHIVPLNQFGANDPCNMQTTCEECNKSKSDRLENPIYKYEPWW